MRKHFIHSAFVIRDVLFHSPLCRYLALAGAGFALIPEHLILPHKELVFLPWEESPHAPMGIYYRQQAAIDKNSAIYKFICTAENYIAELSL
jgi:DNA-binding transcriptional LysR family regulator